MQNKHHTAFIGLGSNLGNGKQLLAKAWVLLGEEEQIALTILSSPFLSAPVDMASDRQFTNCVGRIETSLTPRQLLELLLSIETEFGRARSQSAGEPEDRLIDLDLLYFSTKIINEEHIIIPHPRISKRLFVLVPMVEIEPTYVDPATQESVVFMCKRFYTQIREGEVEEQKIERSAWDEGLFGGDEGELKFA